ncbi:Ion transport protein [Phytophthora infestans]|uniref:Ion transport protein n=1 Tax=Phytophthora infestans TaxID=4787 RepID=A0A8S9V7X2_PHYIN|nr:Ion transport protein [Phytophthora infestans]
MMELKDVTDERTNGRSRENEVEQFNNQQTDESSLQTVKKTHVETIPVLPPTLSNVAPTHLPTETLVTKSYLADKSQKKSHKRKFSVFSALMAKLLTRDLPLLRSPRSIRAMEWRARIDFYLTNPEESHIGWRLHQILMLVLFLNVGVMASETLDGPRFGSSDPDFSYMLSESSYDAIETLFSLLYIVEFLVRWSTASKQDQFWKSIITWIRLLAAVASLPKLAALVVGADTRQAEVIIYNLRILRAVRLIIAAYAFVGTKVLFRAVSDAIPPLTITLFFLITVVMVFATAIFYAEPCYDLQTCTFTDIFNTGYFVMLTVATVGYGSQVPSMHNAGSLLLVCMVMIFGTIYFSMPLAIVGIKYELAWTDYDEYAKSLKQGQSAPITPRRRRSSSALSIQTPRRQIVNAIAGTNNEPDDTLQKIDAHVIKYASSVTCDRFYKLSQGILDASFTLQSIITPPDNGSNPPMTLEAVIQSTKRRSDEASQALDGVMAIIKLHSRVCAEAHELVQASLASKDQENDLNGFMSSGKGSRKDTRGKRSTTRMSVAKGKIAAIGSKAMKAITHHDSHADMNNLRAQIWNIFEYRQDIWQARIVNKMRMLSVVLSIAMFYLQTTPELQKTGLQTFLCLRNVHDYCARYDQPGCYVFREVPSSGSGIAVQVTEQHLDLDCSIGDPDETCYGSGVNFASDTFPLSCSDVFPSSSGIEHVCRNRLCNPPVQFLFDMEPLWIYFEFLFGLLFTLEIILQVYSHPVRRHLWGDLRFISNILVLLPFYVEIVELLIGEWPTYSVVPAMPSFFTAVRFLKSLRILKLGTHIPGARVLIRTAQLVTERLAIPLFFLFLGCVVSAAVFFEMERGTECFVGTTCMWWHKNVLTPEMSEGLPTGKRILVQNTLLSIITDMVRSTWFSLVSFTTVGYGDLHPRTSLGKLIDIVGMIFSSCYTAMPLTLVGGQFYICYELHAQEERMKKERTQARINPGKLSPRQVLQGKTSIVNGMDKSTASRDNSPERQNEVLNGTIAVEDPNAVHAMSNAALSPPTTAREEEPTTTQPYTRLTEAQIINHFFIMQKVFHETIKDISLLNQLGMERVNTMRKKLSEAATLLVDVRRREEVIETKILENMNFCVTACLNFAGMVERIIGAERAEKPTRSTGHTNALLAAADVTNELLQSAKLTNSRRSVSGRFPDGMPRLQAKQTFKRMATVSKVLAGSQNRSGRANAKWAEYTDNPNQNQNQPQPY